MPPRTDDGIVVVVWVFALTLLMACLALTVDLGDLAQGAGAVSNAADAAALAGAGQLAQAIASKPLAVESLEATGYGCRGDGAAARCRDYGWIAGYYVYSGELVPGAEPAAAVPCADRSCGGWFEIVTGPAGPGQIPAADALRDAVTSGTEPAWRCIKWVAGPGQLCERFAFPSPSATSAVDWEVGTRAPVEATSRALGLLVAGFGVRADLASPSCAAPPGFVEAEGWNGVDCIAYSLRQVGPRPDVVFWVDLIVPIGGGAPFERSVFVDDQVSSVQRMSWASSLYGLCSGTGGGGC